MISKTISHYKILEKIGEGGMGEVYLAEDTKLDRKVALKFLPKEFTKDKDAGERFEREARAAAALNHPNIVTIFEINEYEDQVFLAMEYVEGQTLKEILSGVEAGLASARATARAILTLDEIINITTQICEGLQKAHDVGIVHRDIKPQNIIINKDGQVKILDFGIAKLKGVSQLTKESSTLGTVHYMSPEQAKGLEVDHRTDIWSLGIVLYEMITGHLPFKGDYEQAVVYSIINEKQKPVMSICTGVPHELERIINKTLVKDPSDRYLHFDDLLVDLGNINERSEKDIKETKREIFRDKKQRIRRYILPIILLLTMIIVVGGYFIFKNKESGLSAVKNINEAKWKNSIAVLPFVDMSEKSDQEYFCDGMTEDIITKLTQIKELKVISRTSVMRYKKIHKDIRDIGSELDVSTILEGSVRKEKDRIRVTAQLINIRDGSHLWADTFDRKLENLFDLQNEVSRSIANALELKFSPGGFPTAKPKNFNAYDYYLKMGHWTDIYLISRNEDDFLKVLKYSEMALEADPEYAEIYSGLAWAHNTHYNVTGLPEDGNPVIKNCMIAYRLNPNLPGTNAAIGYVYFRQGQHEKTAFHLKKALSLNSNSSELNHVTGFILYNLGLYEKAIKYLKKAVESNPFYLYSPQVLGNLYINLGKSGQAQLYYKKALKLSPGDLYLLTSMANLFIMNYKYEEAENYLRNAEKINPDYSGVKTSRAFWFAALGKKREALSIKQISNRRKGQLYSLLGMKVEALKLISDGSESSYLSLLKHPFYKNLQGEKQYEDLLQKLKRKYELIVKIYKDF